MYSTVDLTAFRHATWGGPVSADHLTFLGENLADAAFAWSFADSPGGAIRITLGNRPLGQQGMSATYDPDYVHPRTGRRVGATIVIPQIDEATFENLPDPVVASDSLVLVHTFYVTRPSAAKQALFEGTFRILQGAPN